MTGRQVWAWAAGTAAALRRSAQGAAAAEFAIIVPVMGVLLTGTVDLAQYANQGLILDAAARAGANYALSCSAETYDCATGIQNAVSAYAASLGATVTVTFPKADASTSWYPQHCTWDSDTSTTVSCDNSANPCSGAQCPKHTYVKLQIVQTLPSPLMPLSIMPSTLTRSLTVRVL